MRHRLPTSLRSLRMLSSRRQAASARCALPLLAQRPDFYVASKDGLTIGPGKWRSRRAGGSDHHAGRRRIAQVGPLKIQGVYTVDADPCQRVGRRAPERRLGTLVAIHVEEG